MTEELKPCPFCGKPPSEPEKSSASDERNGYNFTVSISCECGVSVVKKSKRLDSGWCCDNGEAVQEAVKTWNTRHTPEGYALVPVEPTEYILSAGYKNHYRMNTELGKQKAILDYHSMITAAQEQDQ